MTKIRLLGSAIAVAAFATAAPATAQLQSAISASQQTAADTAQSQARIDQLDDETARLLQDYRAELKQLDQLKRYNESLRKQVTSQDEEISSLSLQIDAISGLQRSVIPLMEDMLVSLEQFVAADTPFLEDERSRRVARLQASMANASLSPAQKYRLLVEAFQIENEYGRTIEAYPEVLTIDGAEKEVEILRIGRAILIYKTQDDSELKYFDRTTGEWTDLDKGAYLADVRIALRMAKEQIPPNLIFVPVTAPTAE